MGKRVQASINNPIFLNMYSVLLADPTKLRQLNHKLHGVHLIVTCVCEYSCLDTHLPTTCTCVTYIHTCKEYSRYTHIYLQLFWRSSINCMQCNAETLLTLCWSQPILQKFSSLTTSFFIFEMFILITWETNGISGMQTILVQWQSLLMFARTPFYFLPASHKNVQVCVVTHSFIPVHTHLY